MSATHYANKVAVITGGASGIGAAIGERFGKEGAKIALLDFDPKMLAETSKRFRDMGIEILDITCDVTDEKQCDKAIKSVLNGESWVDLPAAPAHIRRMQHDMARQAELVSHSYGNEPNRKVRIFRN